MEIAGAQGFPQYLALGTNMRAWALAQLGSVSEGIAQGRDGIAAWHALGAAVGLSGLMALFAESQLAGVQTLAALQTTDEAVKWIDGNTEGCWECLLRCCRGDIFRALGDFEHAHGEYEIALAVTRRQEAKFWELRAATSLARIWRDQGKRTEARDLLAPIYGWFTEGFDTPVLQDAKALLDQLV